MVLSSELVGAIDGTGSSASNSGSGLFSAEFRIHSCRGLTALKGRNRLPRFPLSFAFEFELAPKCFALERDSEHFGCCRRARSALSLSPASMNFALSLSVGKREYTRYDSSTEVGDSASPIPSVPVVSDMLACFLGGVEVSSKQAVVFVGGAGLGKTPPQRALYFHLHRGVSFQIGV
eukprot:scaffold1464_cov64-Attheya_sp.AAC.4